MNIKKAFSIGIYGNENTFSPPMAYTYLIQKWDKIFITIGQVIMAGLQKEELPKADEAEILDPIREKIKGKYNFSQTSPLQVLKYQ